MFDDLLRDLRFGLRMLRRQPGAAIVIVLTLALGIGANTAIFSVVEAVLLRPLPVADPGQLVLFARQPFSGMVSSNTPPTGAWNVFSKDAYDFLEGAHLPFKALAASASTDDAVTARVLTPSGAVQADAETRAVAHLVSANYFDVMGVRAALGRTLDPGDDPPNAPPVVVISDRCWHNLFHADARAIGGLVRINQATFTVVGVTPPPFFGERVQTAPDFWVPLAWQPAIQRRESLLVRPDYYWLALIGRLAAGQTLASAEPMATAALRQFLTAQAGTSLDTVVRERIRGTQVEMTSGARGISFAREQESSSLLLLLAAVGLVLLIACANVATLLLCRATARGTEVAVRRALGASRVRLVRQWLTESLLLAVMGALSGVLVARWAVPWLQSFFPFGPVQADVNGRVLAFATAVAILASFVFGLAPAVQAGRSDALAALRSTGRGTARRRRPFGAIEPFVIGQIAVSLVLVLGATLFARSLFNLEREPLGFDQDRILLARINPRLAGYTPADVGPLYRRIYDQVAALPGVESASFARYSPFGGYTSSFTATIDGYAPPDGQTLHLEAVEVGPNYPQTIGMPLTAGRAIGLQDVAGAKAVAMVNDAFVRRYFPTSSPIGHWFRLNDEFEIVGVVKDALFHSARDQTIPFVFTPMLQDTSQRSLDCEIELRTRGNVEGLAAAVRRVVASADARVAVTRVRTLRQQVLQTFGPERLAAGFVSAFAGLALLLAAVGLYGVVAYSVVRRTREIGVRLALGAAGGQILWLILRETLLWLATGIALGGVGAIIGGRFVASRLFGVSATDIPSFAAASAILTAVAVVASLVPAGRALRVHPTTALRAE